jgi:hypothetical protein
MGAKAEAAPTHAAARTALNIATRLQAGCTVDLLSRPKVVISKKINRKIAGSPRNKGSRKLNRRCSYCTKPASPCFMKHVEPLRDFPSPSCLPRPHRCSVSLPLTSTAPPPAPEISAGERAEPQGPGLGAAPARAAPAQLQPTHVAYGCSSSCSRPYAPSHCARRSRPRRPPQLPSCARLSLERCRRRCLGNAQASARGGRVRQEGRRQRACAARSNRRWCPPASARRSRARWRTSWLRSTSPFSQTTARRPFT